MPYSSCCQTVRYMLYSISVCLSVCLTVIISGLYTVTDAIFTCPHACQSVCLFLFVHHICFSAYACLCVVLSLVSLHVYLCVCLSVIISDSKPTCRLARSDNTICAVSAKPEPIAARLSYSNKQRRVAGIYSIKCTTIAKRGDGHRHMVMPPTSPPGTTQREPTLHSPPRTQGGIHNHG